jgi:hypothetical protein
MQTKIFRRIFKLKFLISLIYQLLFLYYIIQQYPMKNNIVIAMQGAFMLFGGLLLILGIDHMVVD